MNVVMDIRRRTRLVLSGIVLALGLAVAGCMPGPPPAPDVSDWLLTLEDGFDDPNSGFVRDSYAHGRWFYQDGLYGIEVKKENWVMTSWQGSFSDFVLEVDVTPREEAGRAGVVFRVAPDGNRYYSFSICVDGRYTLEKLLSYEDENAEWATILPWRNSRHIKTGLEMNRLRVVCAGSRMWLYVNDHYLGTVEDESFGVGALGMQATNVAGSPGALFYFDNLRVYTPPPR